MSIETARSLAPEPVVETSPEGTRVAIIGRPNVGKSWPASGPPLGM